jgi:hypothetical protein
VAHNSRARLPKAGAILISTILTIAGCSRQQPKPTLTAEGREYVKNKNLLLSEVSMKATDSLAGQTLTEIEGNIKNAGGRTVDRVEVTCIFFDFNGNKLYQERGVLVRSTMKPGEMRRFRLAFDTIPEGWNNQLPQLAIALVTFG